MTSLDLALDDASLLRQVVAGDAGAYRELVNRHLRAITAYAQRMTRSREEAEDVVQETFLRAWQHADSYRPQAKVTTWLHSIAHNLAVDRLRRRRPLADTEAVEEAPGSDRPSTSLMRKQTALAVNEALEALPERQRAAITLVHYQGLTNPEAAEVLGVGVEAVESLLARARRTLRERLSPTVHDDG